MKSGILNNDEAKNIGMTDQHVNQDWKIIFLVSIAHAISHFFQLVLPSLYISLAQEFGFEFIQLGMLVSAFYIISGIGQASSGFIVDRIGARPVLWFGLSCFIVSGLCISNANGYGMLMLGALIGGMGNSVFHPTDYSIINHRVSAKRLGHAFSTHGLSGNLGWALAPIFIATITLQSSWRIAVFAASVLVALVLLLTIFGRNLIGDTISDDIRLDQPITSSVNPTGVTQQDSFISKLTALLSRPVLWGAFLFFAFSSIALSSVINYTIPLLGKLYDVSKVTASSALSGYMVASALGMLAGGFLVSATPRTERTVMISLILAGSTLVILSMGWVPAFLAAPVVGLAGFCSGIAAPSRDMLIRRVTPKGATGSVYGLVYSGMDVGSALGPLIFGFLLDIGITQGPWLGAGLSFVIAAFLAQWIAVRSKMLPVSG